LTTVIFASCSMGNSDNGWRKFGSEEFPDSSRAPPGGKSIEELSSVELSELCSTVAACKTACSSKWGTLSHNRLGEESSATPVWGIPFH